MSEEKRQRIAIIGNSSINLSYELARLMLKDKGTKGIIPVGIIPIDSEEIMVQEQEELGERKWAILKDCERDNVNTLRMVTEKEKLKNNITVIIDSRTPQSQILELKMSRTSWEFNPLDVKKKSRGKGKKNKNKYNGL